MALSVGHRHLGLFVALIIQQTLVCNAKGRQPLLDASINTQEGQHDAADTSLDDSVVLKLTPTIFDGNIFGENNDRVHNWIVFYTLPWFEPCMRLSQEYSALASDWENTLNSGSVLNLNVRFASVNCASHKPLCNTMDADHFPLVRHYRSGKLIASWKGRGKDDVSKLKSFLEKQLGDLETGHEVREHFVDDVWQSLVELVLPGELVFDWLLVGLLVGVNLWFVARWKVTSHTDDKSNGVSDQVAPRVKKLAVSGCDTTDDDLTGVHKMMPEEWLQKQLTLEL
eukprot:TRINITY_DN49377_c0_g1_i1.p1 TRINITY_DN49377_c0_g1~~TRINITY_DN49377_c0_g1_i1.p1  ORF type:complete len:283 (-),score=46.11 TRINITY_DN49377_c0_g1_i1:80-928(-)